MRVLNLKIPHELESFLMKKPDYIFDEKSLVSLFSDEYEKFQLFDDLAVLENETMAVRSVINDLRIKGIANGVLIKQQQTEVEETNINNILVIGGIGYDSALILYYYKSDINPVVVYMNYNAELVQVSNSFLDFMNQIHLKFKID